jgi:hypothetical protein
MAARSTASARLYPRGAIDGRSRRGKRLRALIREFSAPSEFAYLSAADQVLVTQCATKALEAEIMRDALARGAEVDAEQSVRIGNILSRLLAQLERRRKATAPRQKTLAEHLAERAAKGSI